MSHPSAYNIAITALPPAVGASAPAAPGASDRPAEGGPTAVANAPLPTALAELELELAWFADLLDRRLRRYFAPDRAAPDPAPAAALPGPPNLTASLTPYARCVREHAQEPAARVALVLALVPHLQPRLLDPFFTRNATFDRRFTEFGGLRQDDDFEPTGETLAFLLDGGSLAARVAAAAVLDPEHALVAGDTLRPEPVHPDQPLLKAPLRLAPDQLALFTTGHRPRPALSPGFPAQRLTTALAWDDLILHPGTLAQLAEVRTFVAHGDTLLNDWGLAARLRPGLRALFHGPPGTGKTMSAALLGRQTGREVYRIDLSLVVSKYIGETEKNLGRVFDRAQRRGWILFFDEAEALFGKRSEARDAHDRYANQEIAFLLQRIETFDGIAILASNLRANLDDAFARRFELVVYFPPPRPAERLVLWQRGLSPKARLDPDVDLERLAREHELTGGSIMNVIRQASLAAIAAGERPIARGDLERAIRRELEKEGRQG